MGKYFSKFPAITYNGQIAKNILCRPKIDRNKHSSPNTFYDYTLPEEQRADVVSNDYYDNPDYSWLIYLANGVVDPYHDYFLSENDFNLFIIKKYGSLSAAMDTIRSWALNWGTDQRELTPAQYAALPGPHKKYWMAVVANAYVEPHKYVRARTDHIVDTNRTGFITVADPSEFMVGVEFVGLDTNGDNYIAVPSTISGNTIGIKHIISSISADEYVLPADSLYHVANIPADESVYWAPLSHYDFEAAVNASKRNISLVNKQIAFQIEKDLKKVINQ